jgi:site-specific DNA-cytosine methylase
MLIDTSSEPVRRDLLTVREIGRLKSFKDDFIFLNIVDKQYNDVLKAIPPIVAKLAAKTLLRVICRSRIVELRNPEQSLRGTKRTRLSSDT